jgi:hypothetical protein
VVWVCTSLPVLLDSIAPGPPEPSAPSRPGGPFGADRTGLAGRPGRPGRTGRPRSTSGTGLTGRPDVSGRAWRTGCTCGAGCTRCARCPGGPCRAGCADGPDASGRTRGTTRARRPGSTRGTRAVHPANPDAVLVGAARRGLADDAEVPGLDSEQALMTRHSWFGRSAATAVPAVPATAATARVARESEARARGPVITS